MLKILPSAVPGSLTSESAGDILDFIQWHCVVVCSRHLGVDQPGSRKTAKTLEQTQKPRGVQIVQMRCEM